MKFLPYIISVLMLLSLTQCVEQEAISTDPLLHDLNAGMTQVVSEDLFSPPVAARIYAYVNLAAYTALDDQSPESQTFWSSVQGLDTPPHAPERFDLPTAVITAYSEVGRTLIYRTHLLDSLKDQMTQKYVRASAVEKTSGREWGQQVAQWILKRSSQDGYQATRKMANYEVRQTPSAWQPTAPMFGEALEPHWPRLQPFFMDSAAQFRLAPPPPFDSTASSAFYAAAMDVMKAVKTEDSTGLLKAIYWDCNPGPTQVKGHVMQVNKQNTPPGHWMGIHSIVARSQQTDLLTSARVHAILTMSIHDAMIAAWDTKFHYHLLRPETYIQRYIDADWRPLIESPLFPEYASAHSAVSAVSAVILNHFYGEVPFYDDTNISFGHAPKKFQNAEEAAREAARSRYDGGIHYLFSSEGGYLQGEQIGQFVLNELGVTE